MTAGELRQLLDGVPDSMPVAVEHSAGCCLEEEDLGARVEDGLFVVSTDVHA